MSGAARTAESHDAILGVAPARAYWPERTDDCSDALESERGRIGFIGGGTELGLGRPPTGLDAVLRTGRMTRILDYAPADMVLAAEAGVTLGQLQAVAAAERQMLALDPPLAERATLGGIIATGGFGPRRARYGGVRDLILGVTLVRADGVVARGGGKVVKNVAGFDLPKLVCGSLGTLGLIAEAIVRLHPLPETGATALVTGISAVGVVNTVRRARMAQLEPTRAVALPVGGTFELGLRFEGFAQGVKEQMARIAELAAGSGHACELLADDTAFWQRHDRVRTARPLRIKIAALPASLPAVAPLVAPILAALTGGSFAWYASLGLGFVGGEVAGPDAAPAALAIDAARTALVEAGGSLVVEEAPAALRGAVDPWGPAPPAFPLMTELKQRFDPEGRLNPGRFVGGL